MVSHSDSKDCQGAATDVFHRPQEIVLPLSASARLLDLLIVGAGISGISAACHMARHCPEKSWAILEARDDIVRY